MAKSNPWAFVPRAEFPPHKVPLASFAGHHRRALDDLRQLAPKIDLVLELRDCRAPLSTINPLLARAMPGVPVITLYTKRDIGKVKQSLLAPVHRMNLDEFRMVDVDQRKHAGRLLRDIRGLAAAQHPPNPLGFKALVCGMPNAGKSTFINQFMRIVYGRRARKVARTGDIPGVTRALSEQICVSRAPDVYVVDSPGVLMPQVHDWEQMLRLCLVGAVPRTLVDPVVLADYLLFHVNRQYPLGGRYPGPLSNDIYEVLWNVACTARRRPQRDSWEPEQTAREWVDRFIRGGISKIMLDDMSIENIERVLARNAAAEFEWRR